MQTIDIVGELREGVSRKIDDTVYVVSYIPQSYYWGWSYEQDTTVAPKEQAWVYSFNVADPQNLRLVQKLKIFEGGSLYAEDPVTGGSVDRYFSGVAISATSNSLMVVENWHVSAWTPGTGTPTGRYTCGSYANDQRAIVSIVDVSDPTGVIRLHTRFQTQGSLGDQFKQTYVYDEATGTATYYGIFARQAWSSSDCVGTQFVQNSIESWDVTNGAAPVRLDALDFGKPNETVRGSAFDPSRKVAYAITAQAIDPLYVLSYADRSNLAIRSEIDGLSGDMTLFRLVEGNQYLIGIGRDASQTCSGFQGSESRRGIGMAVSLIDVRNLDGIRLMQRQCVAVDNAEWVGSEINWNLDQAHKMIGMHSDGTTNVLTVPVSYYKRSQDNSWYWYRWETAVGIMSWDVAAFDPAKQPAASDRHQELRHVPAPERRGAPIDRVHPSGDDAAADDDQPVRHAHLDREPARPGQPTGGVDRRAGPLHRPALRVRQPRRRAHRRHSLRLLRRVAGADRIPRQGGGWRAGRARRCWRGSRPARW